MAIANGIHSLQSSILRLPKGSMRPLVNASKLSGFRSRISQRLSRGCYSRASSGDLVSGDLLSGDLALSETRLSIGRWG